MIPHKRQKKSSGTTEEGLLQNNETPQHNENTRRDWLLCLLIFWLGLPTLIYISYGELFESLIPCASFLTMLALTSFCLQEFPSPNDATHEREHKQKRKPTRADKAVLWAAVCSLGPIVVFIAGWLWISVAGWPKFPFLYFPQLLFGVVAPLWASLYLMPVLDETWHRLTLLVITGFFVAFSIPTWLHLFGIRKATMEYVFF